jgi:hypothetical protein
MLPVSLYINPKLGLAALNLATALLPSDQPPNLSPKVCIEDGRLEEGAGGAEDDSLTKLHLGMADAVHICLHAQYGPGEEVVVRCGDAEADIPRCVWGWGGGWGWCSNDMCVWLGPEGGPGGFEGWYACSCVILEWSEEHRTTTQEAPQVWLMCT